MEAFKRRRATERVSAGLELWMVWGVIVGLAATTLQARQVSFERKSRVRKGQQEARCRNKKVE